MPPELSEGLVKMTNEALSAEVSSDRWIRILDTLAFSPIRAAGACRCRCRPSLRPSWRQAIARMGSRLPEMAHIFGIEPETASQRRKRRAAEKQRRQDRARAPPKTEPARIPLRETRLRRETRFRRDAPAGDSPMRRPAVPRPRSAAAEPTPEVPVEAGDQ